MGRITVGVWFRAILSIGRPNRGAHTHINLEPFLEPEEGIPSPYLEIYETVGKKLAECAVNSVVIEKGAAEEKTYEGVSALGGKLNLFCDKKEILPGIH